MDQPEEILEKLERFNVQKNPEITRELDEYVSFVARTGESVFNWTLVKKLYREKLINVITEFYNETPTKELPQYPNVDPFNYETMKKMLIERLDSFSAAPFTIQRISELLSDPRKQYSRIDKFMRAVEKNILVVSTVSPSRNRSEGSENGDSLDSVGMLGNGDFSSDVNVDIDMENEGSFAMTREFSSTAHRKESNHDIMTETQETVTIKKVSSKEEEEEATTSTIALNVSNGTALKPTQTDIKKDTQSTVTITICEESKQATEEKAEKSDEIADEIEKSEDSVIKHEPITLLTENVEPKIDDSLLNEPLRPVDDEILPESLETTPLAALESIVASRVEVVAESPRVEESIAQKPEVIEDIKVDEELPKENEQKEQKSEEITETDESGIEAKRIRIEEEAEISPKTTEQASMPSTEDLKTETVIKVDNSQAVKEAAESSKDKQETNEEPVVSQEKKTEKEATEEIPLIEPIVETKDVEDIPAAVEEPIIKPVSEPEIVAKPIEAVPEPIAEPVVENTMALDEDISATPQIAQEMPELEPATNNKMDTDENESENVLMDTDETEEPMDQ